MRTAKPDFERDINAKSNRTGNHPGVPLCAAASRRGRPWFRAALFFAVLLLPLAAAAALPVATDLQAVARRAERSRVPVLVFFYAHSCAYCREVDHLFLEPEYADPAFHRKVIIRQVNVRSTRALRDFSGAMTSQAAFARRYGVALTPTVILLDAHGRQLVPPLVGVGNPDFYGSYLDAAVTRAAAKLQRGTVPGPTAFAAGR